MNRRFFQLASKGLLDKGPALSSSVIAPRGYKHLRFDLNAKKGVAVLTMNRPPVNSLNLDFLTEMKATFSNLEDNKSCRGIILTSGIPKIFTAGLDLIEMNKPERDKLQVFWTALQDLWQTLYGSSLITIAAINGNSPAGGCLLSLGCDYRIMAEDFAIGLNETKLDLYAPGWLKDAFVNTVGHRQAELALQHGEMFPAHEALRINLVDKVVPVDQVKQSAEHEMDKWLTVPDLPRIISKTQLRSPTLEHFVKMRGRDLDSFTSFILSEPVQKALGRYMEQLKKKTKRK